MTQAYRRTMQRDHHSHRSQPFPTGSGAQQLGHVLVVDDDPAMVTSLSDLLRGEGHQATGVGTVVEAAECLRSGEFDLVIADVVMPNGGGVELLQLTREIDSDLPVIMMTAFASVDSAVTAISEGAYDYLVKPIDHHELTLTVSRAIEKYQLRRSTDRLMQDLASANQTLQRRVAELDALHDVSASMSGITDLPVLLSEIVRAATGVIGARYGSILLVDPARRTLTVAAATGLDATPADTRVVSMSDTIAGHVATTGESVLIEDVETDARFARRNRPQFESNSVVAVPLRIHRTILGVICLSDPTARRMFSESDLRLLNTLAVQAAVAINDSRHYQELRRRLKEVTVLHELATRLTEVERTDQMVMAVFAACDQLVVSDRLQWWRWNHTEGALYLDTDSHQTAHREDSPVVVGGLAPRDIEDEGKIVKELTAALMPAGDDKTPLTAMTIAVRSSERPLGVFAMVRNGDRPFDDDTRQLARLVGTQAERIFERQRALLNASRLVTMGNMISEIAHDLRKPLTNIRGSLQILMSNDKSPEETNAILESTDQEIVRLATLVKELVDFSSPTRYHTEKRDICPVLQRAVDLIRSSAQKHNVEIVTELPAKLRPIFCDENQLTEAFLNVMFNAVEAMAKGGRLTVRASVEPAFASSRDEVLVVIADTGPGLGPRELDRVFERYYTTKSTGTGLGLAIVQRIVASCDGTIAAESTPGQGTTFTFRFPVR